MREVSHNALDVDGKVFPVMIPFIVCEVKRPFLSLAMLEDKVCHMSVKDGCRTLGDMAGRCACKDKETRILLMWNSKGDCWKEGEMRFPSWTRGSCGQ